MTTEDEQTTLLQPPRVSVLIPTHNRPHYLEIALKSVIAQTYTNIEICISDNSDNTDTQNVVTGYLRQFENIQYYRRAGMTATENWDKCLELSTGEFANYLMDDDIYHPEKIARMMRYFLANASVGLSTSYRQLIDKDGNFLQDLPQTKRLFEQDALINGGTLGKHILVHGTNVVGEPTTALIRRQVIQHGFGYFHGKRYKLLSDVATWLSVLEQSDCAYISSPMSYFRLHDGQDQNSAKNVRVNSTVEWFDLLFEAYDHQLFFDSRDECADTLKGKLEYFIDYLSSHRDAMNAEGIDREGVHRVTERGLQILKAHGYKFAFLK